MCGLVSAADLASLEKTPFVTDMVEKTLDRLHLEWLPMMAKYRPHDVMGLVKALQVLLVRAALGKKLDALLGPCAVVPGKLTAEKLNELLGFWSKAVDEKFPTLDFGKATGLAKFQTLAPAAAGDLYTVTTDAPAAPRTRQPVLTSPPQRLTLSLFTPLVRPSSSREGRP